MRLQACLQLLEGTGGRLFQHVLPVAGPMRLQQRDDTRLYGTDKERTLCAARFLWEALAKKMAAAQICVSSFYHDPWLVDMASQAIFARHTGGQTYLYTRHA